MKKNIKRINTVIVAMAMVMSLAACGGTEAEVNTSADAETRDDVQTEEEYVEERYGSEEASGEAEPGESKEDAKTIADSGSEADAKTAEEPEESEEEEPDFKIMYFIEWGSGRGVHSSFKVNPEDEWSCSLDFWADYEVADGRCTMNEKIEGLYYEAPIDFTRLVTGDKEETYIMVCDQDRKFVVGYFVDESQMDSCFPWEGYDKVVNGHFAVWFTPDFDVDTAQRILDSCEVFSGEELDLKFTELQNRYVPES